LARAAAAQDENTIDELPTKDIPTEISPLVTAVNRLLTRLRDAFASQRRFVQDAAHELRLKYAFKHVEDWSYGSAFTTNTDLALAQYVWHFGRGWDIDLWGRTVVLRGGGTSQAGAGIELGRMVYRSVRLAAGYSVNGFDDSDITATDAWSDGFGIRIQMILSDWMLADFERLQ